MVDEARTEIQLQREWKKRDEIMGSKDLIVVSKWAIDRKVYKEIFISFYEERKNLFKVAAVLDRLF